MLPTVSSTNLNPVNLTRPISALEVSLATISYQRKQETLPTCDSLSLRGSFRTSGGSDPVPRNCGEAGMIDAATE